MANYQIYNFQNLSLGINNPRSLGEAGTYISNAGFSLPGAGDTVSNTAFFGQIPLVDGDSPQIGTWVAGIRLQNGTLKVTTYQGTDRNNVEVLNGGTIQATTMLGGVPSGMWLEFRSAVSGT